jgi:cell division transport system ATP-binding protein
VVTLEHIGKRYGAGPEVLHDVSLALEPGEFRFLVGASGSGKTTLLKIISLAEPPSQGSLRLLGADVGALDRAGRAGLRRRVGVVFQEFRFIDRLTVGENVALPLRIAGLPEAEIGERVAALLRWFDLEEKTDAPPSELCGSGKQRVALARAIATRPDLLIADEPTGHGDAETADLLVRVFERLNRLGTTVLIATHDIGFARRFEHRCAELEGGSLRGVDALVQ